MSPAPAERGEGDDRSPIDRLVLRAYLVLGTGAVLGYAALAMICPTIWAILTAMLFATVLGLVTTKVVLRIESPGKMWCLTPVCGLGWLLILWLLFRLAAVLS
jgi:hypothetical protein